MTIQRIPEYPYPLDITSFEKTEKYLIEFRDSVQEEATARIEDFESMIIADLTVVDYSVQTSFKPTTDAAVDMGATGYRFRDAHISRNITDGTNSLTVANAKTAYDNRVDTWGNGLEYSSQTAAVDYNTTNLKITSNELDTIQSIATGASPTFASASLGTGELTTGSINRASGALTLEIGGTAVETIASTGITVAGNMLISKASQGTNVTVNADSDQNANIAWQTAGSAEWQMYRPANSTDLRLNEYGVADQFTFGAGGNYGIGVTAFGASAGRVLGMGTGTAPTTSPADMVQLWSADRSTDHAFLQYRAEGGVARNFDVVYNVKDYGATGDGSTDDTAKIQAALDAAPTGSAVYFPATANYYKLVTNKLDVDTNSITLLGDGAGSTIQQTSSSTDILNIDKSDVTIDKLNLVGSGQGATGGVAIDVSGADKDNYLSNIKIIDTDISLCARGIWGNFVEQFEFRGGKVIGVERSGIVLLSCQDGSIHNYHIEDVAGDNNADYGIAITRTIGAEATYPTSKRIDVHDNLIKDVPNWEGYDTHGGERINFFDNIAINCHIGIMVCSDEDTGNTIHVPIDCDVIGNTVDSESDAGDRAYGVYFGGSSNDTTLRATGKVVGNTVRRHGYVAAGGEHVGGMHIATTEGVPIEDNTLVECVSSGIVLYGNNYGFSTTGNTVLNLWGKSTGANEVRGISVSVDENKGYIGANTFRKGTFTAPANGTSIYFDSANGQGVYIGDYSGNDIVLGNNYSEATTYLLDSGNHTKSYFGSNVGIGTATFGTAMVGGLAMANAVAPSGNVTNCFQMYSADIAAGNATPHFRTENGTIVKLDQAIDTTASATFAGLTVNGDGIFQGSDTRKIALGNSSNVEHAFLQLTVDGILKIDADSSIQFHPNNTGAGSFLSTGQLDLAYDIYMTNSKPIKWDNFADDDKLVCMNLDANDDLNVGGDNAINSVVIGAAGVPVLSPNQPAFLAFNSVTDADETGDGTVVTTVEFDTEVFDQGGNFAASTFTAPVTGKYFFSFNIRVAGVTASEANCQIKLITTTADYLLLYCDPNAFCVGDQGYLGGSMIVPLTATNTAKMQIAIYDGNKVVDIYGNASIELASWFSGYLVC